MDMNVLISYTIYINVIVIIPEDYLCNTHIYRIFCHVTLRKTRLKIALTVYTFVLLLKGGHVLYQIHICYIFLY